MQIPLLHTGQFVTNTPVLPLESGLVYEVQALLIVTREQVRPNSVENPSGLANRLSRISLLGPQLGNLGGDV